MKLIYQITAVVFGLALLPSIAIAAASCPNATATPAPTCAMYSPQVCPSQTECDHGWQQLKPSAPIYTLPRSFTRETDGRLTLNTCFLSDAPFSPQCSSQDSSVSVPFTSLEVWCETLKGIQNPLECSTDDCIRPTFAGFCGLAL